MEYRCAPSRLLFAVLWLKFRTLGRLGRGSTNCPMDFYTFRFLGPHILRGDDDVHLTVLFNTKAYTCLTDVFLHPLGAMSGHRTCTRRGIFVSCQLFVVSSANRVTQGWLFLVQGKTDTEVGHWCFLLSFFNILPMMGGLPVSCHALFFYADKHSSRRFIWSDWFSEWLRLKKKKTCPAPGTCWIFPIPIPAAASGYLLGEQQTQTGNESRLCSSDSSLSQ